MRAAILAATMLCGLATGAEAAVVSYDTSFQASALAAISGTDRPTSLTPFNTTLGTVTSASVELLGTFNLSSFPLLLIGGTAPTVASVTPHLEVFPLSPRATIFATQVGRPVVNGRITGLQSFNFDLTGSLPLIYATDPSPFLNLFPSAVISNTNGTFDQADTTDFDPSTVNGIARVSYTYDPATTASPVPEPASIAMLGLGIAAFGVVRRRVRLDRAA